MRAARLRTAPLRCSALSLAAVLLTAAPSAPARADRWDSATQAGLEAQRSGRYDTAEAQFVAALHSAEAQDDPRLADSLDNLARLYTERGRYAQAEPLFVRALEHREHVHGPNHPDVAVGLMNLGWLMDAQGRYTEAEPVYARAVAIRQAALGADALVADALFALADVHAFQRRFDDAVAEYKQALQIFAQKLGPTHLRSADAVGRMAWVTAIQGNTDASAPLFERAIQLYEATPADPADVVLSLHLLAGLFQERDLFAQAERLYQWALKIMEANLGPDHPNMGSGLNNLAGVYFAQGRYTDAMPLYERALQIAEKHLGADHPGVATAHNTLASVQEAVGMYADAEAHYRQAHDIRVQALGAEHAEVANSLDLLASLYTRVGEYAQVEPLHRRALEIREKSPDADALDIATSLNNLGAFYHAMGELDAAEPLYARAQEITEQHVDDDDPATAIGLNNLAAIAFLRGDFAAAEPLYRRSLKIREAALEDNNPTIATALNNLAALYEAQERYADADGLYTRALRIQEQVFGADHPVLATTLNNRARLYHVQARYAEAEPLFLRAVAIAGEGFGEEHPAYARFAHNAGVTYGCAGKPHEALRHEIAGLRAVRGVLEDMSLWAPEARLQAYLATLEYRYDQFYSLLAQYPTLAEQEAVRAVEAHLAYKGLTLETLSRRQRLALLSGDPKLAKVISELQRVTQRYAALALAGPGRGDPQEHERMLADLEREKDRLEETLARGSTDFARARAATHVTVEGLAAAIPDGGVYLDFVTYQPYDYTKARWTVGDRYLAFALTKDAANKPVVHVRDLGSARELDDAIGKLRQALESTASAVRGIGGVRPAVAREARANVRDLSRAVSALVLDPLAADVKGARVFCVSPGGDLHLIPFEILTVPGGDSYVSDDAPVLYALGRDLFASNMVGSRAEDDGNLYVFAAPDFGAPRPARRRGRETADIPTLERGSVRGWPVTFEPLPGTATEAEAIQGLGGRRRVSTFTGAKATEARFKDMKRPGGIHVATHGFFLADVERLEQGDARGIGGATALTVEDINPAALWRTLDTRNPLLRSGLAFAGFNLLAEGAGDADADDDGVLTALEVTSMDLLGTELVVLSACDTGLGQVQRGRGVAGLRRAFRVAGARHVLMSLWSVPDEETVWLMEEFHRRHLAGETPLLALQSARQHVRQRLVERDGMDHPYYWAAFVLESVALN